MKDKEKEKISWREKLVLILVIFLIKMIKPWEYDHQFKDFWVEIKTTIEQ